MGIASVLVCGPDFDDHVALFQNGLVEIMDGSNPVEAFGAKVELKRLMAK
jgi:hypothetical protein